MDASKLESPAMADAGQPDPLAKAVAAGYVEAEAPSHDERVKTLIADVEHAMKSNAPISPAMFHELKALLG